MKKNDLKESIARKLYTRKIRLKQGISKKLTLDEQTALSQFWKP
jgi:hypothetical protein